MSKREDELQAQVHALQQALVTLREENVQLTAIRRDRARLRAAEVIEGLAGFTSAAQTGDKRGIDAARALVMVIDEARQVASGIILPPPVGN